MNFNTDWVDSIFAMYPDKEECKVYMMDKLFQHRNEIKREDYFYLIEYINEWE